MEGILEFFRSLQGERLQELIQVGGFAALVLIVFAETGLFFGFFLPGDSLLFTAGALVGSGALHAPPPLAGDPTTGILALNGALMAAAILGDNTGYWFGRLTGPKLFSRPDSRLFRREYLLRAQEFYEQHGGKTLILARWMPFVRTFAPIVAGIAKMPYRRYIIFSISGGITWISSMTLLGFFLGSVPLVKQHSEKVIILIVVLSLLPAVLHTWKERKKKAETPAG
jgi:membrane-associated protein